MLDDLWNSLMILDPTSTEDPDHKQHNPRTQEETALGQPISRYLIFVIKPQGYGTPVNRITKNNLGLSCNTTYLTEKQRSLERSERRPEQFAEV